MGTLTFTKLFLRERLPIKHTKNRNKLIIEKEVLGLKSPESQINKIEAIKLKDKQRRPNQNFKIL